MTFDRRRESCGVLDNFDSVASQGFTRSNLNKFSLMGSCDFVSGWVGGVCGLVTGHPIDTIKVNQQNRGIGMIECTKQIFVNHGVKGFFRGMMFPIISASTINSIFFGVYRVSLERIMELGNEDRLLQFLTVNNQELQNANSMRKHSYSAAFLAGCIGGTAQLSLSVPVDLVKIKLQTSPSFSTTKTVKYRGPLSVVRYILKTSGPRGLYHGIGVTMLRDIPSSGLYMCTYAVISDLLLKFDFLRDVEGTPNATRTLVAGGLAGMISWWSIIPLDVLKSRIQADDPLDPKFKGLRDCAQQIFRQHGYKGFMRGALTLSLRAFPVNAITFLGYEWSNTLCCSLTSRNYIRDRGC